MTLKKTGYEKTGFDGVHVCEWQVVDKEIKNCGKPPKCQTPKTNEVELCKQWIKEHMEPYPLINLAHSSYGLKHDVERDKHQYIGSGAFAYAAIESGYEYIIDYDTNNAYFAVKIVNQGDSFEDDHIHNCENDCVGKNQYNQPIDQEDYNHAIKSVVDQKYSDNIRQRWRKLSMFLTHDFYHDWYDMGWDRIANNYENTHPLFRELLANILSVIAGINVHGRQSYTNSPEGVAFEGFIMKISKLSPTQQEEMKRLYDNDEAFLKLEYPEFYDLVSQLPIYFREPRWMNGICYSVPLPKAENIVRLMSSNTWLRDILNRILDLSGKARYKVIEIEK
jgi:hypothetical protein